MNLNACVCCGAGRARDHLDLTKYWAKGLTGKDQVRDLGEADRQGSGT